MTPERWAQIEDLFHRAAECDATRRAALLDEACNGDLELRREVETLLSSESSARDHVQAAVQSEVHDFGFSLVGEVISHYRILDGLGGGGMGLVYRAEDIKLSRQVALKFLPEESAKDPAALARFEREAHAASALEHPNICPIYEFGEHEGQPFLVMQLLEGQTLRELLEKRKAANPESGRGSHRAQLSDRLALPLEQVLDIASQIADGLEVAHKKGIIHRDIKPANIFVKSEGQAKILDFGLAKLARGATNGADEPGRHTHDGNSEQTTRATAPLATPDPFLSRTGVVMGTAGYMSPEQARGEKLDARTDLFSFGLALYEMATGQRAFQGDTGPALYNAILTQTPTPARQVNPKIPARLENIINKAIEKNRDARYRTAAEMRAELEALKIGSRRSPRWRAMAAGATLVLSVSLTFWFVRRQLRSSQAPPKIQLRQLTINSSENPVRSGAISPDGKYLAYVDTKGMHVKVIETGETQAVPQPEALETGGVNWEILPSTWFPDNRRFVANAHPASENPDTWSSKTSSIWVVSVLGGEPHKLRDNALAWSVSPDGSLISFQVGDREIWLMGPSGEQAHKLYDAGQRSAICCLNFFRNERRVSYITTDESGDTLVARDLEGGPLTTLLPTSELKKMGDGSWLPDGRLIYSVKEPQAVGDTCNYWTMRLNPRTGEMIEKPEQLTNWAGFCVGDPSVSADGKRLTFLETSAGHGTAYVADLERGGTRVVNSRHFTLEEGDDFIADWTPDSRAVIVGFNRGDHYGFYKQFLNSDAQESIVSSADGSVEVAQLSPDGKWVIVAVYPNGRSAQQPLMRVPIGGGSPQLIFPRRPESPFSCARAPSMLCTVAERSEDRRQMIVTSFDPIKGRGPEIARFEVDPNLDQNVDNLLFAISPDGTRLAVTRSPDSPIEIHSLRGQPTFTIHAPGLDKLWNIGWAADGKALFVARHVHDDTELLHVDLQGKITQLWKSNGPRCDGTPSPDGRHLAIYDWKQSSNMWMMENF